jgi:4-amino-4-deoxy-L-arabinose transferase-like glycosyltransferase
MKNILAPRPEPPIARFNKLAEVNPASPRSLFVLLIAALVIRLAVLGLGADRGLFYPDETEYLELAKNLATHNEFSYKGHLTSFRPPGFPFLLSLAFRLFGNASPVPARLVQVLFGVATVWVMYRLGKDGWGERVGLIAAAVFAFYPTLIGFTNILLTEPSCIFFVSLAGWAMLRCLQQPRLGWAVAAGVALGVSALIRDTLFYAGPITAVFLAIWGWRERSSFRLKPAVSFVAGFLLAILPWCVRNTLLNGQPTLISAVGGITFYLCNNEKAPLLRSSSLFYEKQIGEEYYYETLLPELNGLSETEKNDIVTRLAFEYMWANPGTTLVRMLGRLVDFWGQERLVINHVVSDYYGDVPFVITVMIVAAVFGIYSLVMTGAGFGYFFAKLRAFEVLGLLFIAYYTAMHLLVFAHPRYHLPLLPFLVIMAARAFAERTEIIKKRRTWQFAGAAGVAAAFVVMWIIGLFVFDASFLEKFMQRLG